MPHLPMEGVRILEVAQYTYTPAAAAVLADWGADVIKVEHPVMGDAQRGMQTGPTSYGVGSFKPIMEHPNRGKRSIGLALDKPQGRAILDQLIECSDVFLTNFLPRARTKLHLDVDDIWSVNPETIYVRGTAFGARGSEAAQGGFDSSAFWARGGGGAGVTPRNFDGVLGMPAPAYGDSIGGLTMAGGIAAALFARERTGKASIVDVSLLAVGAWASALAITIALLKNEPFVYEPMKTGSAQFNPLVGNVQTADDKWINLAMLQPSRYWAEFCELIERSDLIDDPRFRDSALLSANAPEAAEIVRNEIRKRPFDEWMQRFRTLSGQWAPIQNSLDVGRDAQLRANGFIQEIVDADGVARELVANPVQFDETEARLRRAPQFAEHTDDVLQELGYSQEELIQLKVDDIVT
jgi:crotonobetainyl-CoA:carnitine CoA-transferase CaiB-like acyl-CoA transferase